MTVLFSHTRHTSTAQPVQEGSSTSFLASWVTFPTITVRPESAQSPLYTSPQSRDTRSPWSITRLPGMPWTTSSFTEMHM